MTVKMYEVGGCVRDELMGIMSKDIDFTVEAESYGVMREELQRLGFEIFLETPEFLTIRARFPRSMSQWGTWEFGPKFRPTADFVLARKEGAYSDGRRPDEVEPGTIWDDLARRDFTVNAMAKAEDGTLIDPHGGAADLQAGLLRCVGSPFIRFSEDALRSLRAIRFRVTKGLRWSDSISGAMASLWLPPLLASISAERVRDELLRCFHADTLQTMDILTHEVSREFLEACLGGKLWLRPTLEE